MDKTKNAKVVALIIFCVVCVNVGWDNDWNIVGIQQGCDFGTRLYYHFIHANIFHALLNAWCLLSIVFIYNITLWRMVVAYAIASSVPDFCLSHIPTVGLSGMVFALFGRISFEVKRKLYYQAWMIAYLVIGFLFPNVNAWIHLYCYAIGFAVALINKPIKISKNEQRYT